MTRTQFNGSQIGDGTITYEDIAGATAGYILAATGVTSTVWAKNNKLANRIYVGASGNYSTIKEAVDWFNASATGDTEILIDAGHHAVAATVKVNQTSKYALQIRGLGSNISYLEAATGLSGAAMFNFKTNCDLNKVTCSGAGLTGYGGITGENCVTFNGDTGIYSELTDLFIDTFHKGVSDVVGVDKYLFNFVISNCTKGIEVNYGTTGIATSLDVEVANFNACGIGVDLMKAASENFQLCHLIFNQTGTETAIKYTGGDYVYGSVSNIFNCTYNNLGTFLSGFDFSLANGRDANIVVMGNAGIEDKTPHAKINVIGSTASVAVSATGLFYKAGFTNTDSYTCKMGIDNNKMTYLSNHARDGMMWVSGNVKVDQNNRIITSAIRRNIAVASVAGTGSTVTVTTTVGHGLSSGERVQMLGWTGGTGVWNSVSAPYVILVTGPTTFTYSATGSGGPPTGGTAGAILSQVAIRCTNQNVTYPFSLCCYIPDMHQNGFQEIYVTSSNAGDNVIVQDITWLFDAR